MELEQAAEVRPGPALEYGTLIALLPFRSLSADSTHALYRALSAWDAARTPDATASTVIISADNGLHALIRAYLMGLLAASSGDAKTAEAQLADVRRASGASTHEARVRDIQAAIRGELAWHRSPASAVGSLSFENEAYYPVFIGSPFWSESRERYRRAQALAAAGNDTAAVRWFSSFESTTQDDLMYLPPSEFERGRIYERLGQPAQAATNYRAFLKWWADADPEFQPLVQEARRRLAALHAS